MIAEAGRADDHAGVCLERGLAWPGSTRAAPRQDDALTVLRARYARGEIDNDEFDERRKRLET